MKLYFAAASAAVLALVVASSATASTASQREYKRGFSDCSAGRWDENQHGASYKEGCRAAEDKKNAGGAATGGGAASGAAPAGQSSEAEPGDLPEAVLQKMLATCRARAAKAYKADANMVDTKYEGTRTDGTHPVNGMIRIGDEQKTFQCNFDKKGKRLTKFIKN
jgi:hypothetical protein